MLFLLLALHFLYTDAIFYCPPDTFQMPSENVCGIAVPQSEYYHDVVTSCYKRGGIVAKIQNAFENAYFNALIQDDFDNQPPYIGVEKKPNGSWVYADGTPLTYSHWAPGEPKSGSSILCAIMDPSNGQWLSTDCTDPRPSFCTMIGNEGPCPSNWLYFEQTKACYYLQNFIYPDSQSWKYWNFNEAEAVCQGMHGHLVSIHSNIEHDFVMDLIGTNANTTDHLGFLSLDGQHVCWWVWIWTGLVGTGVINDGYWTDGTPVDYSPPEIVDPQERNSTNNWIMSSDPSCDDRRSPTSWFTLLATYRYPVSCAKCRQRVSSCS